jgi:hypothetical protein
MLSYVEQQPRDALAAHVECVWEVADRREPAQRRAERVLPDGCPELILHLGDPFARQVGGRWVVQPRAFLAGPLTKPWLLRAGRRVRTVGMRFRPGATTAAFRIRMRDACDRELPLAGLVGARRAVLVPAGITLVRRGDSAAARRILPSRRGRRRPTLQKGIRGEDR